LLEVRGISARYGLAQALSDVSLDVRAGEVVTLCGRNGAGKTTLLRTVIGLQRAVTGQVLLEGRDITRAPAHTRARLGLGFVPDDRGIYATLTVEEHLRLPPTVSDTGWSVGQVYDAFPRLADRRASPGTRLSGGEQQMLAIARVLRMGARVLLCDEPTEGLSPRLVQQIGEILRQVKERGIAVLLVEQNLHFAATVADRHYLLAQGRVVASLENSEVREREEELVEHLGI